MHSVVYATKEAKLSQKTDDPHKEKPKAEKENEDLRVRRTRKLIQQALIELTVEKGFSTITVQDIADRAMINRSTFYRYYLDKYDLVDQYLDYVHNLTPEEEFVAEKLSGNPEDIPRGPVNLFKHIQEFADFYRAMLGPKGDPYFTERLRQNTIRRFQYLLANVPAETDPNGPPIDLRISYVAYAGIGAIVWWLDHLDKVTPEQLARWMGQISTSSIGLSWKLAANRTKPE
jgi:AcrR family transcriptional regulator